MRILVFFLIYVFVVFKWRKEYKIGVFPYRYIIMFTLFLLFFNFEQSAIYIGKQECFYDSIYCKAS